MQTVSRRSITESEMLADLNGLSDPPHGLVGPWDIYRNVNLRLAGNREKQSGIYVREIRTVVDLWLSVGEAQVSRRRAERSRQSARDEHLLARAEWEMLEKKHLQRLANTKAKGRKAQELALKEIESEDLALYGRRLVPAKRQVDRANREFSKAVKRCMNLESQILSIMSATLECTKNVVGYSPNREDFRVLIEPTDDLFKPIMKHEPALPPKSDLNRNDYATEEGYILALLEEQSATITKVAAIGPQNPSEAESGPDDWAIRRIAWFNFVQMLTSDWKAVIGKCTHPRCKARYFRLGKVNTEVRSTACRECRPRIKKAGAQERNDRIRKASEDTIYDFVARRFKDAMRRDLEGWYRPREMQVRIAREVTAKIKRSSLAVQRRFRGKVTPQWIVSGAAERKNYARVAEAFQKLLRSCMKDPESIENEDLDCESIRPPERRSRPKTKPLA